MTIRTNTILLGLCAALMLGVAGCASYNRETYESTTWSPKSFSLVDTRDGSELWAFDLPVGSTITIDFNSGDSDNLTYPMEMEWKVRYPGGDTERGSMATPPNGTARLDMTLREAPEYPRERAPRGDLQPLPEPEAQDEPAVDEGGSSDGG
ncbi:MAG: hypothetical protein AAFX79_08585 [Planctomycetota bacterium]